MKTLLTQVFLITLCVGRGIAQQAGSEKHVKDIRAEQPQKLISATPLCQEVRAAGHQMDHLPAVEPSTLEADLPSLMQKTDEVALVGAFTDSVNALSPSRKDVVQYFDVRVLRSWKGSHKVGDVLTFGVPWGGVRCGLEPDSSLTFFTLTGGSDWLGIASSGPWILFLRYSRGDEADTILSLRLAGGNGLQGFFEVDRPKPGDECYAALPGNGQRCSSALDSSQEPISVRYRLDPLKKTYDKMPVSIFLKEVQTVAHTGTPKNNSSSAVR